MYVGAVGLYSTFSMAQPTSSPTQLQQNQLYVNEKHYGNSMF